MIRISVFILSTIAVISCTQNPVSVSPNSSNGETKVALGSEAISVSPATQDQCAFGGSVFNVYHDQNANAVYDPSDILISSQVVCNGKAGSNGHSTLINTTRVSTGFLACASGSGLQINLGLDTNDNAILDPSEISTPQIVCDGANGAAGMPGSNGTSMVFQTVAASAQQCPAGGTVIMMALDSDHTGQISTADQNFQSLTFCNGEKAPPTNYTPVEPILACGNQVAYKEVLLRLSNGQVLGSFSQDVSGSMTRLSFLPDGNYINTDSSGCQFSLSTSGDGLSRSISWFGSVQMTWPFNP